MIAENKNGKLIIERTNNGLFILIEDKQGRSSIEIPIRMFMDIAKELMEKEYGFKAKDKEEIDNE